MNLSNVLTKESRVCGTWSCVLPEEQPCQRDERYSTAGFLTHAAPTFLVFITEGREDKSSRENKNLGLPQVIIN